MKNYLLLHFLFVIALFSCSEKEDIANTDLGPQRDKSEFIVTEQELISNVSEFLDGFYSDETSSRGAGLKQNKPKIKDISILTEKDFSQAIKSRSAAEGIRVDSLLYFVNLDDGFIIAGADKRTTPIFAIIDSGNFSKEIFKSDDANDLPFLEYLERTLYVVNKDVDDNELYNANSSNSRAYPIKEKIFPLLGKTKWGQDKPYSTYCPPPDTTPTGCVITALAQVSSYYKSPKVVDYGANIEQNPLNKSFDLNLDWDKILANSNSYGGRILHVNYDLVNETYNESQAVALYMRYIGKIVNATYASLETGANTKTAILYMRNYIGLQATDEHLFNRTNLYKQIKGGNLVVLFGYANSKGGLFPRYSTGHAWLADGVFVSNHDHHYFHYNWGWNGKYNGFFFEDRWNPGKSEFNDAGDEVPQGDDGRNFKYYLKCSYISW